MSVRDIPFSRAIGGMVQFAHGQANGIGCVERSITDGRYHISMVDREKDFSVFELYFSEKDVVRCEIDDTGRIYITIAARIL